MIWWWWSYGCLNECIWMQWMMWCIVQMNVQTHAYEATSKLCIPLGMTKISLSFIFRCKFRIPLGTSFELLRLLFRRYRFCIPLGTSFELLYLIFRWYLALHSLRNDFWVENLRCAPLGTTFCNFVVLCIPLGTTFELLPIFFSFSALDGACSDFTFYIFFWGDFALVELNKKGKITNYAPIKNLSPPFGKEKDVIGKMKKITSSYTLYRRSSSTFQDLGMSLSSISFNL